MDHDDLSHIHRTKGFSQRVRSRITPSEETNVRHNFLLFVGTIIVLFPILYGFREAQVRHTFLLIVGTIIVLYAILYALMALHLHRRHRGRVPRIFPSLPKTHPAINVTLIIATIIVLYASLYTLFSFDT